MQSRSFQLVLVTLLVSLTCLACSPKGDHSTVNQNKDFVSIKGQNFIDPQGRTLTLHGINVVNKNKEAKYLGHITPEEFAKFKSWGFNVVRLGIIWDGLEPEPGVYNEDYLQGIDQMIQWASESDLYVFLDMHQDLYSVEFSDGAPSWATITNDLPEALQDDEWVQTFNEGLEFANIYYAKNTVWEQIDVAIGEELERLSVDELTAEEFLTSAEERVNDILASE